MESGDTGTRAFDPPPARIPHGVWVLGLVSLLMDVSSELIHSLLPMFMVTTLGASALEVGWIEGIAESTALIIKVFSGALSDYLGKRKGLAVFGYGLAALTKPLFALAPTLGVVFTARLLDRVTRGVKMSHFVRSKSEPLFRKVGSFARDPSATQGRVDGNSCAQGSGPLGASDSP